MHRGPYALARLVAAASVLLAQGALAQVPSWAPPAKEPAAASNNAKPAPAEATEPKPSVTDPAASEPLVADAALAKPAVAGAVTTTTPSQDADDASECPDHICSGEVHVGTGYHPFDHLYLLTGVNWTWSPCNSNVFELETSTAYVFDNLIWLGAWGSVGFRAPSGDKKKAPCADLTEQEDALRNPGKFDVAGGRFGFGGELGWRILAVDFGYLHDNAVRDLPQTGGRGWRFRGGLAFSQELFTSQFASYRRSCCRPACHDAVPCECERHPAGVSVFVYYAHEHFWKDPGATATFRDNMFGISLKIGVGL